MVGGPGAQLFTLLEVWVLGVGMSTLTHNKFSSGNKTHNTLSTRRLSISGIMCLSKRSNLLSYVHLANSVGSGHLYQSVKDGQFLIDTCTAPEYLMPLGNVCNSILGT